MGSSCPDNESCLSNVEYDPDLLNCQGVQESAPPDYSYWIRQPLQASGHPKSDIERALRRYLENQENIPTDKFIAGDLAALIWEDRCRTADDVKTTAKVIRKGETDEGRPLVEIEIILPQGSWGAGGENVKTMIKYPPRNLDDVKSIMKFPPRN